jgi:hypothetical protein
MTATPPAVVAPAPTLTFEDEIRSVNLQWPVKPLLAFLPNQQFDADPVPVRLPLLDLVAAAVPDMHQALTARGLVAVGYPTWVITTGSTAGVDPSLNEVLVCRIDVTPVTRAAGPVTS